MCKKDYLEKIISIVSDLTEIEKEDLLSRSRRNDVMEARYLLVYLLKIQGVRPYKIASLLGVPLRNIYYYITAFSLHSDYDGSMLRTWLDQSKSRLQELRNNSATSSHEHRNNS